MNSETRNSPELHRSLGRIEGKLDSLGTTFIQHIQDDKASFTELRLTVSSMQKKLYTFGGAFLIIGYLIPYIVNKFFV